MGAGCDYRDKTFGIKQFWIVYEHEKYDPEEKESEDSIYFFLSDIEDYLTEYLGWEKVGRYRFEKGIFSLQMEDGYNGEILFNMTPNYRMIEDYFPLLKVNYERCYRKLGKDLLKGNYELRTSAGAWTSCPWEP